VATAAWALAASAVFASAAPRPEPGSYTGKIAVWAVSFVVPPRGMEIVEMRTDYEATEGCGPPSNAVVWHDLASMQIGVGSFHGETTIDAPSGIAQHYTVDGEFTSPAHVRGTINIRFNFPHGSLPPCDDTGSFTASRTG
jgi:hypothetical protein